METMRAFWEIVVHRLSVPSKVERTVEATTELGRLFMELAEIEWKHKTELQAEYDATGDPERFLLDM